LLAVSNGAKTAKVCGAARVGLAAALVARLSAMFAIGLDQNTGSSGSRVGNF